jgi:hypothetical protein
MIDESNVQNAKQLESRIVTFLGIKIDWSDEFENTSVQFGYFGASLQRGVNEPAYLIVPALFLKNRNRINRSIIIQSTEDCFMTWNRAIIAIDSDNVSYSQLAKISCRFFSSNFDSWTYLFLAYPVSCPCLTLFIPDNTFVLFPPTRWGPEHAEWAPFLTDWNSRGYSPGSVNLHTCYWFAWLRGES